MSITARESFLFIFCCEKIIELEKTKKTIDKNDFIKYLIKSGVGYS